MSSAISLLKPAAKAAVTLLAVIAAVMLVIALWRAYMLAPWNRDGRVSAQVVRIAPEVNGPVVEVPVTDDRYVKRGDVLYRIDPERFQLAVPQAEAQLAAATAALGQKRDDAQRRKGMEDLVPRVAAGRAGGADAGGRRARLRRQCGLRPAGGWPGLNGGPACRPDCRTEPARPERGVPESRNYGNP